MTDPPCSDTLADLREEIDLIDASLHRLLIERGEIIDRLIEVKAQQGGGSAFRPGREADMMRALVTRHKGLLPLDTVESIWRIIISTFTFVQSHYSVHVDTSGGDAEMRDGCRFHFGFTVPFVPHAGTHAVVAAVAASTGDLGLLRVENPARAGAWWNDLVDPAAPKIIARLPFVERQDHPAGVPLFVVAQPLREAAVHDVVLYAGVLASLRDDSWKSALASLGGEILASASDGPDVSVLIAMPGNRNSDALAAALARGGASVAALVEIGSHAARFDWTAEQTSGEPLGCEAAQ